jgi:hypothetical protein
MARPGLALAALVLLVAAPARAELYKCQGPDGKTLFTSDRTRCPGASQHEPKGRVQRTRAPAAPRATPRGGNPPAAAEGSDDAAEAQVWRNKREKAKAELRRTEDRLALLREVAGWCNRGHEVWAEDADGLRRDVDCEDVDAQAKALRGEQKRLEAYLDEGLEEECRRAGCLPGWIR